MAILDDALKHLNSGRLREGMEILESLARNDPENVSVLYNLGARILLPRHLKPRERSCFDPWLELVSSGVMRLSTQKLGDQPLAVVARAFYAERAPFEQVQMNHFPFDGLRQCFTLFLSLDML
jgi:hypothetical protein